MKVLLVALGLLVLCGTAEAKSLDIRFTHEPGNIVVAKWHGCVIVFQEPKTTKAEARLAMERDLSVSSDCRNLAGTSIAYILSPSGYETNLRSFGFLSDREYMDSLQNRADLLANVLKRDFDFCLTYPNGQPVQCKRGTYNPNPRFEVDGDVQTVSWRACDIHFKSDVSRTEALQLLEYEIKKLDTCKGSGVSAFTMFTDGSAIGYRYRLGDPDNVTNANFMDKMAKRAARLSTFFDRAFLIEFAEPVGGNIIGHVSSADGDSWKQTSETY